MDLQNAFIIKYKYLRLDESIRNIQKSEWSSWLNGMELLDILFIKFYGQGN